MLKSCMDYSGLKDRLSEKSTSPTSLSCQDSKMRNRISTNTITSSYHNKMWLNTSHQNLTKKMKTKRQMKLLEACQHQLSVRCYFSQSQNLQPLVSFHQLKPNCFTLQVHWIKNIVHASLRIKTKHTNDTVEACSRKKRKLANLSLSKVKTFYEEMNSYKLCTVCLAYRSRLSYFVQVKKE